MALGRKISQLQSVNTAGSNDDIPIVQNGVTKKTSVEKINQEQELATVAYSNDYNDLDNTPNLAPVATSNDYNDLENTPNLAPVATSNNYNDLDNLPEIPVQITPTIQQVLEQGDTSTIPFTVSGTNSKAVHSSKGYDVQETDGITVLTTELVSKEVRHVKKVNGTEAGRTELEYEEPTIQAKITIPNKNGIMATTDQVDAKVAKVTSTDNAIVRFNGTTGEVQNSQVFVDDNGKFGLNTQNPKTLLNAVCKSSGFPMAGVVDDKTAMFIAEQSNSVGLLAGVHYVNGNSWMQAQRVDGGSTLYNILLQPIGGNVMIGSTGTPEGVFDARSTTKGSLPFPRMTQAQRLAIASPTVGLHVYQTNGTEGVYVYKSTGWQFAY